MIKVIEDKVGKLQEEIKTVNLTISQLKENVRKSREQIGNFEAHVNKLNGAIEAFNATITAMKTNEPKNESILDAEIVDGAA